MDQQFNNSKNEFLWTLLANPANDARLYAYNLRSLVDDFPQSGILQALLANASDEKNLKQASVYFNSRLLFKLVNAPASLALVPDEKIIRQNNNQLNGYLKVDEQVVADENLTMPADHAVIENNTAETFNVERPPVVTLAEELLPAEDHHAAIEAEIISRISEIQPEVHHTVENLTQPDDIKHEVEENVEKEELISYPPLSETVKELAAIEADVHPVEAVGQFENQLHEAEPAVEEQANVKENHPAKETESEPVETFEEPISVVNVIANNQFHESPAPGRKEGGAVSAEPKETGDKYQFSEINDEADKLIVGNIAATDFFMFSKAFDEHKGQESTATESQALATNNTGHQDVSKYNDEKMPYTFMWWLDKTRKEYAGVHQPYASYAPVDSPAKIKNTTDELQQQYFENIFHLTSVDELDKHTGPQVFEFGVKPKEQVIIERFIKEEPQIKPQSSDKLDNENKAKKSSEDRDELVTETLAAIYSDQMLYHKAIAAYRKLMLKYPEKSRYFASKIEQLEKKTN